MGEFSSEAQMKLLCSLPGMEHSLLGVVKTLSTLATESADRAAMMNHSISDLSAEIKGLKDELVTLKASAIAKPMSSSSRPRAVEPDTQQRAATCQRLSLGAKSSVLVQTQCTVAQNTLQKLRWQRL